MLGRDRVTENLDVLNFYNECNLEVCRSSHTHTQTLCTCIRLKLYPCITKGSHQIKVKAGAPLYIRLLLEVVLKSYKQLLNVEGT